MKRITITAVTILSAALLSDTASAALWGRDKIYSIYISTPTPGGCALSTPALGEPFEDSGFDFRAGNDDSCLYLTISAHEAGAGRILSGDAGRDVLVVFMNGKSRDWGIRLPFAASVKDTPPELPAAEQLVFTGTGFSTGTLRPEVRFSGNLSGRKPYYELAVPLSLLKAGKGGILFDLEAPRSSSAPQRTAKAGAGRAGAGKASRSGFQGDPLRDDAAPETMLGERMSRGGDWMGGVNGRQDSVRNRAFGGDAPERTDPYETEDAVSMRLSVIPASRPGMR